MVSHGQCKVGQAAAAVFNLLRRYARGRGRRHAFRQRTIELRQCRAHDETGSGENEHAKCKRQARPGFPCHTFHREVSSDGKKLRGDCRSAFRRANPFLLFSPVATFDASPKVPPLRP